MVDYKGNGLAPQMSPQEAADRLGQLLAKGANPHAKRAEMLNKELDRTFSILQTKIDKGVDFSENENEYRDLRNQYKNALEEMVKNHPNKELKDEGKI